MNINAKIYIAGHTGLVGSSILRNLISKGYKNFVFSPSNQYDLRNQQQVKDFFSKEKPDYVFMAAAKVGGIVANYTYRADFIYDNLMIQNNIIHEAYKNGVKKLLFLGSSCIYPKSSPQPMKEEYLLTDTLEFTNEPYAIAKIAGIKMCESYNIQYDTNFISAMPTNLYGVNDNFDLEKSHVLPALIRKMHLAKALMDNNENVLRNDLNKYPIEGVNGGAKMSEIKSILNKYHLTEKSIELWGSGKPRREFMHSDDLADACTYLMGNVDFKDMLSGLSNDTTEIRNTHINIGTGKDISIMELASIVRKIVNYSGEIIWNTNKPDGTFQKLLDINKLTKFGWKPNINFRKGIVEVYSNYTA